MVWMRVEAPPLFLFLRISEWHRYLSACHSENGQDWFSYIAHIIYLSAFLLLNEAHYRKETLPPRTLLSEWLINWNYRATTLLWLTWTWQLFRICRCIKHVGKVLSNSLSMTHFSNSKNCDSCILLKNRANDVECRFIVAVVWYSTQQYKLIMHSVNIDLHDSVTVNKKRLVNLLIFWGQLSCPTVLVTIGIQDIIFKLAHRTEKSIIHFFSTPIQ